ncbi:hypothetical protein PUN28_008959 [Cardiocondyla obscurior]|uniref:Uncharacterized protein n=1 Tax=Cardiocondyla obscurior TaxID=286306 RepID=A0AAW2FV95_9HYME
MKNFTNRVTVERGSESNIYFNKKYIKNKFVLTSNKFVLYFVIKQTNHSLHYDWLRMIAAHLVQKRQKEQTRGNSRRHWISRQAQKVLRLV